MKQKLAVITGADGVMVMEITRAVATAGYKVIMACRDPEIAEEKRQLIMRETGNIALEIVPSILLLYLLRLLLPMNFFSVEKLSPC